MQLFINNFFWKTVRSWKWHLKIQFFFNFLCTFIDCILKKTHLTIKKLFVLNLIEHPAEATKSAEPAAAPANASAPVDMLKTEDTASKKKFSFKGLKKVGPMRLVKGFRASTWRPKISLDSQKDVADSLRKRIYERRNKYEKFVDVVLGKATPVQSSAKQPAPGQPAADPVGE